MALPRFCSHCAAPLPSPPPVACRSCDTHGCRGDGCEWQAFEGADCDRCGDAVVRVLAAAA